MCQIIAKIVRIHIGDVLFQSHVSNIDFGYRCIVLKNPPIHINIDNGNILEKIKSYLNLINKPFTICQYDLHEMTKYVKIVEYEYINSKL